MSSPFWKYPSVLNGRIDPQYADAMDLDSGYTGVYYYGAWFFYTYSYGAGAYTSYGYSYTDEAGHVFCLGEDSNGAVASPDYRLSTDDISGVYQTNVDLTDVDLLYFAWRLNNPANMALPVTLVNNGPCQLVLEGIVDAGDGLSGILLPDSAVTLFESAHCERIVRISNCGNPANNGDFRITSVPQSQKHVVSVVTDPATQYANGRFAVIENDVLVAESPANATVTVLGAQWVASAYIDNILCCELREPGCSHHRGRSWQRNNLCAHVSKLAGVHTVKFELSVELLAS